MKKILIALTAMFCFTSCATMDPAYLLSGGAKAVQAATLSEADLQAYISQYVAALDKESNVLPESNAYVKRLRRMTNGLNSVNGTPLNFKVYQTNDVNAFACADGSVRVYTGLMDAMTDDECLGVIGHEIGHVALKHSLKQYKKALLRSGIRDAVISTGGTVASLTASQLGDLGEAMLSASFSRKQETEADDFGYEFLKGAGKNPWAMAMAFEELQKLSTGSTASGTTSASGGSVSNLFSSHPATEARIQRMSQRATADGYKRPAK